MNQSHSLRNVLAMMSIRRINQEGSFQRTPLRKFLKLNKKLSKLWFLDYAGISGNTECAYLLLEYGAHVNVQDEKGWTR